MTATQSDIVKLEARINALEYKLIIKLGLMQVVSVTLALAIYPSFFG